MALEARAQAEWVRVWTARAAEEAREETEDDRGERTAENWEDARKWSGIAEDLMWRHAGVGW